MGSSLYYYCTPYRDDIGAALQALREEEFRAGRYEPALSMLSFEFPPDEESPAPGPAHATIEEAVFDDDAHAGAGTRSILDLLWVASAPDYSAASPFSDAELSEMFGTVMPSREQVLAHMISSKNWMPAVARIMRAIERGQGRYIVLYTDDAPSEIFFMGYSFD